MGRGLLRRAHARSLRDHCRLSDATACDGRLYWIESRPAERGRSVLMVATPGGPAEDVTAADIDVRSRVHEYGGRPYAVAGSCVMFCGFKDQRFYAQHAGRSPRPLTPIGYRYADGATSADGRTIFLVREDHLKPGEPANAIVALDLEIESPGQVLFDAADFVAYPRPSPDGRMAFIAWDHPNMPWTRRRCMSAG